MARKNVLQIRLSDLEFEQLTKEANGVTISKFARTKLLGNFDYDRFENLKELRGEIMEAEREQQRKEVAARIEKGVNKAKVLKEIPLDKAMEFLSTDKGTPQPRKPKKVNQACEVLGHTPVVTDVEGVVKCSRCGARWRI